jgi:hypothetical protein
VRAEVTIPQNSLQLNVAVFINTVESGIRTIRLRYSRVNPIVRPKPGSTRRLFGIGFIKASVH